MEAKHKNEEARKAKKGLKKGEMVSLAPPGASWAPLQVGGALGTPLGLGTNSAAKFSFREIRVSTPYISFLTPPKPVLKHL